MPAAIHDDRDQHATEAIIRDCLALGDSHASRGPVRERLEEALGPDLARRLVVGLTARARRRR